MANQNPILQSFLDLMDYFKQGHDFKDLFFDTWIDHCTSRGLLFGMMGNPVMASLYNQAASFFKELKEMTKKQ